MTRTEYRIEYRVAPDAPWAYGSFTGAASISRTAIDRALAKAKEQAPGWEFRIMERQTTITSTPWEVVA